MYSQDSHTYIIKFFSTINSNLHITQEKYATDIFFFKERTYLFTTSFKSLKRINHRGDRQMAHFYISQRRLFGVIISKERAVLVPVLGSMPLGL